MGWDGLAAVVDAQNAKKKKKTAVFRSWIQLDCNGKGTILDVDKHSIMERVHINGRDLRILDPLLSYPSAILGRERAIVLNLEHIKAIITAEEVLLRDPLEDNVIAIVEELRRRLLLSNVVQQAQGEGNEKLSAQHDVEAASEEDDELEHVLDDDDDMADLYLSRKLVGASSPSSVSAAPNLFPASATMGSKISRASRASAATCHGNENDVEELEMLLEAYFMQIDGTFNKLTTLREYIGDTEDINIQLDNHRNQLIQLEVFLSSGTACLSFYSLIAGVFGMNIPYSWNEHHGYIFAWVVCGTGIICAMAFLFIIAYARLKGLIGS